MLILFLQFACPLTQEYNEHIVMERYIPLGSIFILCMYACILPPKIHRLDLKLTNLSFQIHMYQKAFEECGCGAVDTFLM